MPGYVGGVTILVFLTTVALRLLLLRRKGIRGMYFGNLDKKDYLIPPFALFYLYAVFAAAFHFPQVSTQRFFQLTAVSWAGASLCLAGLVLIFLSVVSFGKSFRVGIDTDQPDKLVTSGIFALSRNPIYVAFWFVLLGEFLLFSNWILLIYLIAGTWLFHRQVLREEEFLIAHYGQQYAEYCGRVRRYL